MPDNTTVDAGTGAALGRGLRTRHLTMMGLGSAIGAGLFLGTGVGIRAAGPAVIIAYAVTGVITVLIMRMLGEMVAARPSAGTFSSYAEQAFGPWAGFSVGWLYWFMMIMIMGAEMTGAAAIMGAWFGIPAWVPALIAVAVLAAVNLASVRGFGEFEFWFAFVKVAVIIAFLIIGVALIFGWLPGHSFVGTHNITAEGFMPSGVSGVAAGLLAVAFAFGGIELVTIAAAESEDPQRSVHTAVNSIIWRIGLFYIGSVLVISFLLPLQEIKGAQTAAESPFTMVLDMAGIPGVVGIMEVVIVLALLSAFNAQLYGSSRLCYSLAERGDAPAIFRQVSVAQVPIPAVVLSVIFAFGSVGLQWWNPPGLLDFLLSSIGGCLVVIWVTVIASYLRIHPILERRGEITSVRMWGYPWAAWATAAAVGAIVCLMLADPVARTQVLAVTVVCAVILLAAAASFAFRRRRRAA
ncbi:amino acid permease [Corynebacterium uberis]|uniref:amino acid permease n=1 Tax=Corynebacterium TaxID=1716 RepID=UPI001D09B6D9|nr:MULTISPECIES: amino acid permease [Corynebacterium]MCZ9308953.1 amino acid permease [Corynebacterium sp. c6VSa_13]UDL74576.1 amino acid permease [Corynebacterium uberis]UDL76590.1 amino acid permease [Corynebacterium uberis]UDL78803.1 amino acid permease [Corynebacterium uberis]UDL81081.1 amino acid permease [Corynebacterium uberis]